MVNGFGLTMNGCTVKALLEIGHSFKSLVGAYQPKKRQFLLQQKRQNFKVRKVMVKFKNSCVNCFLQSANTMHKVNAQI